MIKYFLRLFFIILFFVNFNVFSADLTVFYYDQAAELYFQEKYTESIELLNKTLDLNPNYIDALIMLAKVYRDLENYDYSYEYIEKAILLSPSRTDLLLFSADIELSLKRYTLAENKYKAIINKEPLNMDAFNGLASLYIETNRSIMARDTLLSIVKADPRNSKALLRLSDYYKDIDKVKADNYFQDNIRQNSLNHEVYFKYSIFNFNLRRIDLALNLINTALEIRKSDNYLEYKALYNLHLKMPDEAIKIYKEILKNKSNDSILYYNLAYSYYLINDYSSAIQSLIKSINLRPDDELAMFMLDKILIDHTDVGDTLRRKRSIEYYQKSIQLKKSAGIDQYVYCLRKSILLDPFNRKSREELAYYYKINNFPERYLRELRLIFEKTKSQDLKHILDMEERNLVYRLGEQWEINQYGITDDSYDIPVFINYNIENKHYASEILYTELLEFISFGKYRYTLYPIVNKEFDRSERMNYSQEIDSDFYLDLKLEEDGNLLTINLLLSNSISSEIIDSFNTYQSGNDKFVLTSSTILRKLDSIIPLRASILKIFGEKALINIGRKHGLKLKDGFYIVQKKKYRLEKGRTSYFVDKSDIKGTAVVIKVDENISEIKYKDKDFFKDIDVGDILILIQK